MSALTGGIENPDLCTWQKKKALTPDDDIFVSIL